MKISDLVNKVEPFKFEYDGFVLEGEYYKYKTTTPNYAKQMLATLPDELAEGTDEEKEAATKARNEAAQKAGLKSIADMIVSWNAEDDQGNSLPLTIELLEQLPAVFTERLVDFFNDLRNGNPTSGNGSQPGSQTQPIPN